MFALPDRLDSPQWWWRPWVTDVDPDTDLSLDGLIELAIAPDADRYLFNEGVQLKWAYCSPETNLWSQYSDPGVLIDAVYRRILDARDLIADVHAGLIEGLDHVGNVLDDPVSWGYTTGDVPELRTHQITLRSHAKTVDRIRKLITDHVNGGRTLRQSVSQRLRSITGPPEFNFRTVEIVGLPFLNGRLVSGVVAQTDAETGRVTYVSNPRFVPYGPEDHVEVSRPIPREFDLTAALERSAERFALARTGRPFGWEWLVRGFLGLTRPSEPPPWRLPVDTLATERVGAYVAEHPDTHDETLAELERRAAELAQWEAWVGGGTFYDEDSGRSWLYDGYTADRSDVVSWFDRLVAGTLFASDAAPFKRIPFVYGPSNTGKSTLFNVIGQLIGPLYGNISTDALLAKRTMKDTSQLIASVMGRRWVVPGSEIPASAQWRSEVVKAYVGNDLLLAERKYENPVSFRPQGGLWVAGNHYLAHEDRDDSMSNRLIYLTFCQPSGRRLTPEEVAQLIDAEADDILLHFAMVHGRMLAEYRTSAEATYWSEAYAYPEDFEPDDDQLATETDPWSGLFDEVFDITGRHEDLQTNDDLYAIFRQWAVQSEGMSYASLPTRSSFVARILKSRPGVWQSKLKGGKRITRGVRLTPVGQSLLVDAQS